MIVDTLLLASIAHDMRTPLAAIHALLDLMAGGADGPLTDAQRSRLQRLSAEADRLTAIANHLSDLSLLHAGRLTLSPGRVELHETVAAAVHQVDPLARSRAVELRLTLGPDLPPLRADAARLRQAIALLLSAAIRGADGGVVELSAEAREPRLEMTVREIARPLPVEALPSGFEVSSDQTRAEADRLEGSLGISVARGLLRLHGGDLRTGTSSLDGVIAVVELPWDSGATAERSGKRLGPRARPG
jgi:signal transduction histidine kinase